MGSRKDINIVSALEEILDQAQELSPKLEKIINRTRDYDLRRQLKKVDAELIDFMHSVSVAIEMKANKDG